MKRRAAQVQSLHGYEPIYSFEVGTSCFEGVTLEKLHRNQEVHIYTSSAARGGAGSFKKVIYI